MGIFKKNIFDISSTIRTLRTGSSSEQTSINTALNYLLSTQHRDGGWGRSEVEESNVYMTSVISIILKQFSHTPQLAASIDKAANYLITKQNANGGFGSNPPAMRETTLAYIALANTAENTTVLDNARSYLISMQFADGSLSDDHNSTVSALRALCFENSKRTEGPKSDRYWHDCGMDRYLSKQAEAPEPDKGSVTGQVIDSLTRAPLKNVSVFLEGDPEIKTMTDRSGIFDLSDIPSGGQKISLTLTAYAPDVVSVNVDSNSTVNLGTVNLLLNPPVENNNEPVTKTAEDSDITISIAELKEDKSTAKAEIPKKDYKRKVSIAMRRRGGYGPVESETIPADESLLSGPKPAKFSSPVVGTIAGSVFDSVTKQAIQNASVIIAGKPSVSTDEQGTFTVHDVVSDICRVTISKEGYTDQFYQGDMAAGETMDMLIYLTPVCLDIDEADETEIISNIRTSFSAAASQKTAINADLIPNLVDVSTDETTDVVTTVPEILLELDERLSPSRIVPYEDKQIKVDIRLEGVKVVTNPVVVFAVTNTAGDKIEVGFDKVMFDPSGKHLQFGVSVNNIPVAVIAAVLNRLDNTKIDLILETPVTDNQVILLSYIAGDVASSDGKGLISFDDQVVKNGVLPPLYGQDGFGYSGLVPQNPLQGNIFMTGYNQWPSGFYKNVLAFISGVFDGQNIWMIPANADSVIKINKDTGVMTGYNRWPAGFRKGNLAFEGGVFDGQGVWLIPANADSVVKIDKDTGVMTEYNDWPAEFKKGGHAFAGGVFDGQSIWMVPSYAESIVKIDKDTGVMIGYNTWPSRFKKGGYAFAGGVFDGQNIWMIPANADSVVKIDKDTGVMTEYNDWPAEFKKSGHDFAGGVFDGQNIWMIPYYADRVVTIDKDTGAMGWHHQRPSEFNKVEYAFTGGVFDGENIWMIPLNADSIVKINKNTGVETKYNQWPTGFSKGVNAFTGGVFDGENIWMIPSSADKVIKLSSFSPVSVSANITANDTFYFYISQDESMEGILIGQGNSWSSVYSLNAALVQGVTNYLHIKSTDVSGPVAAFIGDFLLNDPKFNFKNNKQYLLTGEDDCWTVYTDTFGGNKGTISTICKNGMGRWSTRFGIDLEAQWIWTNEGKDQTTRYFSTPIYYSTVSVDPVSRVRVIDTISEGSSIVIDRNSFTREPYKLSSEGEKTVIEWRFEEILTGQVENFSFDITIKDPVPGEERQVIDKLELFYEDVEKRPVRTEFGASRVHVFSTTLTPFITTDKRTYTSQEDVIIRGTIRSLGECKRSIDAKIVIENSRHVLVEKVADLPNFTLSEREENDFEGLIFKPGINHCGDYRACLILYDNLIKVDEASTDFTIEAVLATSAEETTPVDETDEHVVMTEKTERKIIEENHVEEGITDEIAMEEVSSPNKIPEAGIIPEGVEGDKVDRDTVEAETGIVGIISAQPNPVYQGLAVSISYNVANSEDNDLKDLTVNIMIIDSGTGEIRKTFEAPSRARKGASVDGSFILSTVGFEPRVYAAILQVARTQKEAPKVIARADFEVRLINVTIT
jgi:hypothetical protein